MDLDPCFQEEVRSTLAFIDGVFSPDTAVHTAAGGEHFWTLTAEGISLREVFGNWLFKRSGTTHLIEGMGN